MNTNTTTRTEGQQPGPCITGSQALLESFLREGVDTLFGYPGGAIIPVYDALFDYRDRLRHILVRHEQGAVHAAQGYARVSGRVGVCLVTSGPGATNTVTGLADALMDSTPLVLVTGQVGSSLLGTDAFQETNFVGITQAVTKWNCQVKRTEDIPGAIAKAFYIARSGRPGPVVVDITKDAQCGTAPFRYERLTSIRSYVPAPAPAEECIAEAVRLIDAAQRPLLMAGQGVMLGNAEEELQAFLAKSGIPVASTLLGLSAVARDLFDALLTDKWRPTVPYFEVVCLAGMFYSVGMIAYNVLKIKSRGPLIVRLEGTNVERGREILRQSGMQIIAADDMADGAEKAVQAAKGGSDA